MKNYSGPMRICHRGLVQAGPENTLGAFEGAWRKGFQGLEIDIRRSLDGEILIVHDQNLTRLTVGDPRYFCIRNVETMTWEELSKVRIPYANHLLTKELPKHSEVEDLLLAPWRVLGQVSGCDYETMLKKEPRTASLMRFDDLVSWIRENDVRMTVEVEVKSGGIIPKLYRMIDDSGLADRFIVFSGQPDHIREIQETAARDGKPEGLRLGANIRCLSDDSVKKAVSAMDLWEIGLNDFRFDEADVKWCADRGIRIFSNLGDYPEWWKRMNELGAAGFKTNYPEAYTDWWMSSGQTVR